MDVLNVEYALNYSKQNRNNYNNSPDTKAQKNEFKHRFMRAINNKNTHGINKGESVRFRYNFTIESQ